MDILRIDTKVELAGVALRNAAADEESRYSHVPD